MTHDEAARIEQQLNSLLLRLTKQDHENTTIRQSLDRLLLLLDGGPGKKGLAEEIIESRGVLKNLGEKIDDLEESQKKHEETLAAVTWKLIGLLIASLAALLGALWQFIPGNGHQHR